MSSVQKTGWDALLARVFHVEDEADMHSLSYFPQSMILGLERHRHEEAKAVSPSWVLVWYSLCENSQ